RSLQMSDPFWVLESHRVDNEERERLLRIRAVWSEREPVTPPPEYRRRLADLLVAAANWLDPRPAAPAHSGAGYRRPTRAEAMMLMSLPLHRVNVPARAGEVS